MTIILENGETIELLNPFFEDDIITHTVIDNNTSITSSNGYYRYEYHIFDDLTFMERYELLRKNFIDTKNNIDKNVDLLMNIYNDYLNVSVTFKSINGHDITDTLFEYFQHLKVLCDNRINKFFEIDDGNCSDNNNEYNIATYVEKLETIKYYELSKNKIKRSFKKYYHYSIKYIGILNCDMLNFINIFGSIIEYMYYMYDFKLTYERLNDIPLIKSASKLT
jgi:hypothetical protein